MTLDEIKDKVAQKYTYKSYKEFKDMTRACKTDHIFIMDGIVNEVAKSYAKEKCLEQRVICAEKAITETTINNERFPWSTTNIKIDKSSILNAPEPTFY